MAAGGQYIAFTRLHECRMQLYRLKNTAGISWFYYFVLLFHGFIVLRQLLKILCFMHKDSGPADLPHAEYAGNRADLSDKVFARSVVQVKEGVFHITL